MCAVPNKSASEPTSGAASEPIIEVEVSFGLDADSPAYGLRREVFVEEQGIVEEFSEQDADAYHAVLYRDGEPVACGRVFEDGPGSGHYHLGRFAVRKPYRRCGLGSRVLAILEQTAAALGATEYVLDAQLSAAGFYEKHGYERVTDVYELVNLPHVTMCKQP
jgi:predicted GNAT family N-acyltransferase